MDSNSNFERARKLTKEWPVWKREYQLTKNSQDQQTCNRSHDSKGMEQTTHPKVIPSK